MRPPVARLKHQDIDIVDGMNMNTKAAAVIATCLVVLGGMVQFAAAAGPAGPSCGPAPPAARGPTPDNDSEPNDDFANATLITGNATFSGGVGQGDHDYFKISLSSGATADTLDVQLTTLQGVTAMYIYDPNFFNLLQDGPAAGATLELTFTAQLTGYYYIYLPNMGPCNYSLTTLLGSAPFTSDGDNDPARAVNIETAGYPYSTISTLDNHTDIQDFYKVHLCYTALVSTEVLKAFLVVPPASTFGFLLYPAGGYDSEQQPPMMPNAGQNQSLTFSPTASGDYYLRVWGPRGSGQYTLNVSKASGTADQNDAIEYASSLEKTDAHWYNTTGSLTLGIDPNDFFQIEGVVPGQVFNCTITSADYDARDRTPNIQISLWNSSQVPIPPDPSDVLANPVAYANARVPDAGIVYIELYLTQWAGAYSLSVYTNSPPQTGATPDNISFPENTNNTTINLAQIFSDPENDPLEYSWEMFGDLPGNITVNISDDANRTVTLTPKKNFTGLGSMSWTATDPNGEIATVMIDNVAVTRINHRPEIDQNYTVPPISIPKGGWDNTTLNMNSVFIDPDQGDKLKYAASGNVHIRVSFPLDPENGIWPTGEVMFLPEPGWTGSEVITFTATDYTDDGKPMLTSLPVYVTAEVVEIFVERITVGTVPALNLTEDGMDASLVLRDYFSSNYPNDTFTIVYLSSNLSKLNVTLAADGRLTVRPQADWSGQETIRFRATCPHGLTGNLSIAVNVAPVNDPPVFTGWDPNQTSVAISEGQTQKFKVTVLDKETSANQLKVKWTLDGVNVSSFTEYEFIANYDTVVGQPSKSFNVTVIVNDTQASVSLNWTLTVSNLNRPPRDARITFPPDESVYEEGAKVHLIGAAADDDGDALTFKWYDGTKLLGNGPEFNATKLKVGKHNITLEVSDSQSSTNVTVTIKVNAKKSPGFEIAAVATAAIVALVLVGVSRRRK
jgi:hypothetical protein